MKLMVVDGNSILNRAYYGIRPLSTREGLYTHAVYGFITTLQRLLDEEEPEALCVTFDRREPTFRHQADADYHQPQMPGGGVGLRHRYRRQGQPAAGHGPDQGEAGIHPHGPDHHKGHDPGDLPGAVRLRSHSYDRPEGPDGGHVGQHSRCARGGGKDRHGPGAAIRRHRRTVPPPAGYRRQAQRHPQADGGGGVRPAQLLAGHHRHRCAPGLRPGGEPAQALPAGALRPVPAAGISEAH